MYQNTLKKKILILIGTRNLRKSWEIRIFHGKLINFSSYLLWEHFDKLFEIYEKILENKENIKKFDKKLKKI